MEYSFPEYRIISTETMISTMQESNRNNERFCFILGSGASVESGIPAGTELEKRWMEFLMGKSPDDGVPSKDPNEVRKYAKNLKKENKIKFDFSEIEKNWKEVQNGETSHLSSEYYFDLCTLRFYPKYKNSYRYFERLMEAKEPSLGYRVLAELLTHENNLVVTTNFDSLIEDALFLYTDKKPLVINHESLADYISDPSITRPIIAKIHRGLLFTPLNSINDTDSLKEEWEKVLSIVFKTYTPIVIGYGGGDHSLMEFLQSERAELNQGIYWCYLSKDELPNEKIQKLVEDKDGYLVSIEGFDAFMTAIGSQMCPDVIVPTATNEFLKNRYQSRIDTYTKRWNELESQSLQVKNMRDSELEAEKEREESKLLTYFDYFIRGARFVENGEYDRAIECFDRSIELKDDFAPTYNNRGIAYHNLGQYDDAIADYTRALELSPSYWEVLNNRGISYKSFGRYGKAILDFDRALELNPVCSVAYNSRGVAYSALGLSNNSVVNYHKALEDYNKALELNPDYSEAYNNRGVVYSYLGCQEKAVADYNKALELNSNYAEAYNNRGLTYTKLEDFKNAIADYEKALELNPNYAEAYNNRGNVYYNLGEYESAIADYNRALDLSPSCSETYNNRGLAYHGLREYKNAIDDYNRALKLNPSYWKAYFNRGNVYIDQKMYENAIADYNSTIKLNPNYPDAYGNRANAYDIQGNPENAIADYDKALELNPRDPKVYLNRGLTFSSLLQYENAIADYNKAIQLNPIYKTAYLKRAEVYRVLGKIELAEDDERTAKFL